MNTSEIAALKVGDEIGYGAVTSYGEVYQYGFSKIAKIGGNSIYLTDGKRFTLRGTIWGSGSDWRSCSLIAPDVLRDRLAHFAKEKRLRGCYFSVEKIVEKALKNDRKFTKELKAELIEAANAIEVES